MTIKIGPDLENADFETIHRLGAQRFGVDWLVMNTWIVEGARLAGLEPTEHKRELSYLAWHILSNQEQQEV